MFVTDSQTLSLSWCMFIFSIKLSSIFHPNYCRTAIDRTITIVGYDSWYSCTFCDTYSSATRVLVCSIEFKTSRDQRFILETIWSYWLFFHGPEGNTTCNFHKIFQLLTSIFEDITPSISLFDWFIQSSQWLLNLVIFCWLNTKISHDDVIKWEHFPRYWPFLREIHRLPVNSTDKGLWCFLSSVPE